MKALTLHQPWASLVAAGAKTIETRSWRTSYRGRLAIHAGKTSEWMALVAAGRSCREDDAAICSALADAGYSTMAELPRGAVVASTRLVDCVRIIDATRPVSEGPYVYADLGNFVQVHDGPDDSAPRYSETEVHLGDFTPGRWAWLLDDIAPTTERCPWCWGGIVDVDGWCAVCGDESGEDGRCDPIPASGRRGLWEWQPQGASGVNEWRGS